MPTFDDIEASIDEMKVASDATLQNFPDPKVKTSDLRGILDTVFLELKTIAEKAEEETELMWAEMGNKAPLSHSHSVSAISGLQATLDGIASDLSALSSGKQDKFSGTTAQYVRGDGSLASFPSIPASQVQADWSQGNSASADFIKNKPSIPSAYTDEQAQDAVGGIMSASGGVAVSYNDAANTITLSTPKTWNAPARALNTVFQPSATRDAYVRYSVQITSAATLVLGSRGTVYLRYADNAGFTTNVVEADRQSFGVGSGLVVTGTATVSVGFIIPAGKYVQIVTENTVASPTFAYQSALEVLI